MNAISRPGAPASKASPFANRIWVRQAGRSMQPTIQDGDWVWLEPMSAYAGEGVYLLEVAPGTEDLYRVTFDHGTRGVIVHKEEGCWERYPVDLLTFNRMVRAKAASVTKSLDDNLMRFS